MSQRERMTFSWTPSRPCTGFHFETITREAPGRRHYVYSVTVTDANGDEMHPVNNGWNISQALSTYFMYSSVSTRGNGAVWLCEDYLSEVRLDVVRWSAEASLGNIVGAAFAPYNPDAVTRLWSTFQASGEYSK